MFVFVFLRQSCMIPPAGGANQCWVKPSRSQSLPLWFLNMDCSTQLVCEVMTLLYITNGFAHFCSHTNLYIFNYCMCDFCLCVDPLLLHLPSTDPWIYIFDMTNHIEYKCKAFLTSDTEVTNVSFLVTVVCRHLPNILPFLTVSMDRPVLSLW